ncbi:MAG: S9 family peptidase [Pseudomonadota bacterium]|nr:S9 family peptidase [Pseudomonadota bacterium]
MPSIRLRLAASLFTGAFATLAVCVAAQAAAPALEQFFRTPAIRIASLSPNGRYLASTAMLGGSVQLTVVDLQTREAKKIAGYADVDIFRIEWISNDRLAFNVIDRTSEQNASYSGLFAIDRDGTRERALSAMPAALMLRARQSFNDVAAEPVAYDLVQPLHDGSAGIIALGYFINGDIVPYRIDSVSGRRKAIDFSVTGRAHDFVFDAANRLRVVTAYMDSEGARSAVWYRDDEAQPWRKLAEHATLNPPFRAIGIDPDGLLVVAGVHGRDGVFRYNMADNKVGALVAASADADVNDGLVFDPQTHKLIGVRVRSEPPHTEWLDPQYAALQQGLDQAAPDMVSQVTPGGDAASPRLVFSSSSTDPGRYLRYDPATKQLLPLLTRMPWIVPAQMSPKLVFDYKARDGLPIPSYLTLPKGRPVNRLPLIVLPHGGPAARDDASFDPQVQFLASRGYAVLQPQFRGSTGFGEAHFRKGFRQWGLRMQDDLSDGIADLVKQGAVDPARVCIMGASYGGYAAAMGLVKDPQQYRCGIDLLGVTDIGYLFTIGRWEGNKVVAFHSKITIGDPGQMRDQFVATSPALQAASIRAPLFMAYGEHDTRVPLVHGEDLRDALKKHGKVYEWMTFPDEEHGFTIEANRFRLYRAIDAFLAKYNPAGA